jgi:preprotein translocase SecE subunit
MAKYKAELGTYARTSALWLLGALWLFGCNEFYYFLGSFRGDPEASEPGGLAKRLMEDNVPVLGVPLTLALIISVAVGVVGIVLLMRVLERPKVADMLIDSETEMRKCTWPTWNETFTSSIVILVVMLIFTALLAGMDWVLNEVIAKNILS